MAVHRHAKKGGRDPTQKMLFHVEEAKAKKTNKLDHSSCFFCFSLRLESGRANGWAADDEEGRMMMTRSIPGDPLHAHPLECMRPSG